MPRVRTGTHPDELPGEERAHEQRDDVQHDIRDLPHTVRNSAHHFLCGEQGGQTRTCHLARSLAYVGKRSTPHAPAAAGVPVTSTARRAAMSCVRQME